MEKDHLKSLLERYVPSDWEEETCKPRFQSFIENHEDCFSRSLLVGHVTASAWLLNEDRSKALLMHHRKLDRWLQLGGHCENEDEDVLSTSIREAREESGIPGIEPIDKNIFDIDIHLIPESPKEPSHYHYDVRFLLRAIQGDKRILPNIESRQFKWIGKNDSKIKITDHSVIRLYKKWNKFYL